MVIGRPVVFLDGKYSFFDTYELEVPSRDLGSLGVLFERVRLVKKRFLTGLSATREGIGLLVDYALEDAPAIIEKAGELPILGNIMGAGARYLFGDPSDGQNLKRKHTDSELEKVRCGWHDGEQIKPITPHRPKNGYELYLERIMKGFEE